MGGSFCISPYIAAVGIIITLSLFFTTLMERYIELPAINQGRWLKRQ
jgi:hypothetical protein